MRLDAACSHIVDCEHKTAPLDERGSYFAVGTPAMKDNLINYAEARRISRSTFEAWTRRLRPEPGDLLLAREAPVGPVVRLPDAAIVAPGQRTVLLRPNREVADSRFLYYALAAPSTQARLRMKAEGSTVHHLNVADIRSFHISLPPLSEQKAIAEVLGALDDKIAANTSLVSTADELVWSEFQNYLSKAEVTERATADVATIVLGGTPSRARAEFWTDGTVPWLNSGEVNATRILAPSALITDEALDKSAAKMMRPGTTLIAITGATLGQIARLEIEASGNQSIVGVWSDDADTNVWLYFALRARRDELLSRATGAAQQHVSKADVAQLQLPIPSVETLREFGQCANPLLRLAASAERENATLAKTRDTLIPFLISGELRVRDAEAAVVVAGV